MAMAREIFLKKKRRKPLLWPYVAVALLLVLGVVIFLCIRAKATQEPVSEENQNNTEDSVLNNPLAVCYSHSSKYKAPKIARKRYSQYFDDDNSVQLAAAKRNGIKKLSGRVANYEKYGLVRVESNEYFRVSELKYSVPYLVPAARVMLNTIGKCFQDVLAEKYPKSKYKIVVTSLLRTDEDVRKLVRRNRWATENSCHKHGTTIDISYHNFEKISGRDLGAYEMKEVLAITLSELRSNKLCYIKYERRNCFHITLNEMNVDGITLAAPVSKKPSTNVPETSTPAKKPARTYKNKDAERLHQRDEEKNKKEKPQNYNHYFDQNPSPIL